MLFHRGRGRFLLLFPMTTSHKQLGCGKCGEPSSKKLLVKLQSKGMAPVGLCCCQCEGEAAASPPPGEGAFNIPRLWTLVSLEALWARSLCIDTCSGHWSV